MKYLTSLLLLATLFAAQNSSAKTTITETEPIKPDSLNMKGGSSGLQLELSAYPVPAGDKIVITIEGKDQDNKEKELTYSIGNVIGKKKKKGKVTMKSNDIRQIEIDTGDLAKGVYFFIIEDGADIRILKFLKG